MRLKLTCEWSTTSAPTVEPDYLTSESVSLPEPGVTIEAPTDQPLRNQRIADHVGLDQLELKATDDTVLTEPKHFAPPTEVVSATRESMLHVLITGVFKGWDQVSEEVRAQDLWSKAIIRDTILRSTGHGLATRLALGVLLIALMQVCHLKCKFVVPQLMFLSILQHPIWDLTNASFSYLHGLYQSMHCAHAYSFEPS